MIIEDKRKIKNLCGANGVLCSIGKEMWEVDEIRPYHENGEMAYVVWFEVIKNGNIVSRVNSQYVQGIDYI